MKELYSDFFPVSATDEEACDYAAASVHAFLHGELPEATADEIRHHLMICEHCMDDFDIEATISTLVQRSCSGTPCASGELRARIRRLTVISRQAF
ncbi:zf-HC2 domain-containing protein [Propionibacterium australiense]|uniref:Anti-sigma factor n=1 Tax=Propionibacterium australiense TaxID=119981 RepID=A0A383S544_9ACTN|nr:zf-HC2 domain-containing protein [Propionibacterium australiense]RLP11663.1 mycothiol system anti-sigma-R factor [Propionibacterium australiense]RLP12176.1 mycothiol system anti-sigma-R factor [Propionibacterium australiense]SYZ32396.1 Anti-sigma factor [Propionibacterium australiense]VEH90298.1 anti-sigma factor [Propionibacterium australiense]